MMIGDDDDTIWGQRNSLKWRTCSVSNCKSLPSNGSTSVGTMNYLEEPCKKNWILWELSFHHYHHHHLPHDQMQVRAGTRRVITINRKLYLEEGRAVQIISSVHSRPFSARWILRPNCAPITHCPNCRFRSAQPLLEPFNAHYKIGVAQDMTKTNLRTAAYKW